MYHFILYIQYDNAYIVSKKKKTFFDEVRLFLDCIAH